MKKINSVQLRPVVSGERQQTLLQQLRARTLDESVDDLENSRVRLQHIADPCRLLRAKDVAALLSVHEVTLFSWVRQGRLIPPIRLGLAVTAWRASDLLKWISERPAATSRGKRSKCTKPPKHNLEND